MERLLESVIKGLEAKTDFKSRWCEKFNENCKDYLYNYGNQKKDCGYSCENCDKYRWIIDRAKHYEEKLGISWKEILSSWEDDRHYWFMNYYNESDQPLIEGDDVFVFENLQELYEKCGNEFICPACKGISTDPYECNSGKKIHGKCCDWKSYGLFQFGLAYVYVKSEKKGNKIFKPVKLYKESRKS